MKNVYDFCLDSPPDLIVKENIILNMTNRLANLENEMAGVRHELYKAIEVINRKDAEIAMLRQQLFQQGNQPVQSSIPVPDRRVNKIYEEYNDGYIESPDHCYYDRPNIDWEEKCHDLSNRAAGIEKADILNITFYNDGMKLENGHFRKYSIESALAFFRDLEDGYFPAELKESYPEGVIFKGVRYHVPVESQSAPVLAKEYYPTGHPQQSRTYKQQEYREFANNVRGREMNYDPVSPGSTDDSTSMNTVYDNAYCRNDHKKNIYDTTAELARSRSQKPVQKNPFDPDEEYENIIIIGKKEEKRRRNSEYDAYSGNIENIRASIDSRAAVRNNINKDPHGLQNTLNDNIIQEGQQPHRKINGIKSFREGPAQIPNMRPSSDTNSYGKAKPNMKHYSASKEDDEMRRDTPSMDTEYGRRYSHNVEDIAKSIEKRYSLRSENVTLPDEDAEELQIKFKGNNMPNPVKRPLEGKVPTKNVLYNNQISDKSRSSIQSYNEYEVEDNRRTSFTNPTAKEHDAYSKNTAATFNERSGLRPQTGDMDSYDNEKKFQNFNQEEDQEMQNMFKSKNTAATFNERSGLRPQTGDMDSYDNEKKFQNFNQEEDQEMQNMFKSRNDPNAAKQLSEEKVYKQDMIPINNKTSETQEKSNRMPNIEIKKRRNKDSMSTEYEEAYSHNIGDVTDTLEENISLKHKEQDMTKFQRNNDEKLFSEKNANKLNIIPSNKRSSPGGSEKEDSRISSPMMTEYGDAYGSKIEDDTSMEVENRPMNKSGTTGHGQLVLINSNKESENFVLGNEYSKSPETSEYRDAFGAKFKYVIHQCSTNVHGEEIFNNRDRSIHSDFLKLFSKGKVYEPKIIPLNNKTSDGQIELNMKSYNGNEIYSAFLYPDDSISKVWYLTELNCEEFVVTVDDKILHINVPLKNYNINGDVTLNISKRKPSFVIKEVGPQKSKSYNDEGDVDCSGEEDYYLDKVDNEEGYSS